MKYYLIGRLSRRAEHDEPLLIGRVEADNFQGAAQCLGREIIPPPADYTGVLQLGTVSEDDLFFPTFEERINLDSDLTSLPLLNPQKLDRLLRP